MTKTRMTTTKRKKRTRTKKEKKKIIRVKEETCREGPTGLAAAGLVVSAHEEANLTAWIGGDGGKGVLRCSQTERGTFKTPP